MTGPMAMARRPSRLLLAVAGTLLLAPALFLGTVFAQTGTPGPPTVDTVSAGDRALTAGWSEPSDTGTVIITAYDLRFILTSSDETVDANWTRAGGRVVRRRRPAAHRHRRR